MKYFKKVLMPLSYTFISILILTLLLTILNYSGFIKNNLLSIFKIIIPIISVLIGSIKIGKLSTKKGYLEGIKFGALLTLLLLIINLILQNPFKVKYLLFYIILIITSILGSMIGINKRNQN